MFLIRFQKLFSVIFAVSLGMVLFTVVIICPSFWRETITGKYFWLAVVKGESLKTGVKFRKWKLPVQIQAIDTETVGIWSQIDNLRELACINVKNPGVQNLHVTRGR
ncbi:MAG: hypothetical protein LBQ60_13760, partial [Bacteroidales bacterium]|nr:hypothetical protein [Bacteroidales bacterium]